MNIAPSPRHAPSVAAKWLLIAFVAALLAFEGASAWKMRKTIGSDALLSAALLPWIASSAGLAALLVARARSRAEAWWFVGAEAAAVASTAWLWTYLILIKPDAQNGVAMMVFPVIQLAALAAFALGVVAMADLVTANRKQTRPRLILLTILALSSAVLWLMLAWVFGYIRA